MSTRESKEINSEEDINISSHPDVKKLNNKSKDDYLWNMYNTARLESITSRQLMQNTINWSITSATLVVSLIAFITDKNIFVDKVLITYFEWIITVALGVLGSSQYVGEFGRMLRSGHYSRKLEESNMQEFINYSLPWEMHLSNNRLKASYIYSSISAAFGMIATQFVPFFIYTKALNKSTIEFIGFNIKWWGFPLISAVITSALSIILAMIYLKKYQTK
jgi:hypothetical protein